MTFGQTYTFVVPDIFPVDAQTAGEALEDTYNRHGAVTAENVLDDNREEGKPLHGCFEWDDAIAGEKYRLTQAGKLIRSIVVIKQTGKKEHEATRMLVSCGKPHEYHPINIVLENKDFRAEMLEDARRDFENFKRKYSVLTALAGFFTAADEAWPK